MIEFFIFITLYLISFFFTCILLADKKNRMNGVLIFLAALFLSPVILIWNIALVSYYIMRHYYEKYSKEH